MLFCREGAAIGKPLRGYAAAFLAGRPQQYAGHNPTARIGITLMLALLAVQAGTGLILAGTDFFWPPFGGWFAGWVAAAGVEPRTLLLALLL